MRALRVDGVRSPGRDPGPALVAIGNFDGVHAGHRAMLRAACAEARGKGLAPLVLTFSPHPAAVLGRGEPPLLTPLDRKVELLGRIDPGLCVVVEPFTEELSQRSPEEFARDVLREALDARIVVAGQNFRFGRGRAGDLSTLAALGAALGFEARAEGLAGDAGGAFSSTRARRAVAAADLEVARAVLGRPHALTGRVVHGDGRGRTLGIPTANLAGIEELLPPHGVYACLVDRARDGEGFRRLGTGVLNVGTRPTVAAGWSAEVHVHGDPGDLYGDRLRVHLLSHLRPEHRFPSVEALVERIREDVEAARRRAAAEAPDPLAGGAWA